MKSLNPLRADFVLKEEALKQTKQSEPGAGCIIVVLRRAATGDSTTVDDLNPALPSGP